MNELRTGTVAHVDHGKTTLTAAITMTAAVIQPEYAKPGVYGLLPSGTLVHYAELPSEKAFFEMGADRPVAIMFHDTRNGKTAAEIRQRLKEVALAAGIRDLPEPEPDLLERPIASVVVDEPRYRVGTHFKFDTYPYPPDPYAFLGTPKGKSGKNKSTRKFDLPPRRL